MYNIVFYRDKNGKEPVIEYLDKLHDKSKSSKDSKIKYSKITEYLEVLEREGTRAGIPYTKHLDGDIWELRPLKDRFLFAFWYENNLVILHHFQKKTQKTPIREIEQAKKNLKDFLERIDNK